MPAAQYGLRPAAADAHATEGGEKNAGDQQNGAECGDADQRAEPKQYPVIDAAGERQKITEIDDACDERSDEDRRWRPEYEGANMSKGSTKDRPGSG